MFQVGSALLSLAQLGPAWPSLAQLCPAWDLTFSSSLTTKIFVPFFSTFLICCLVLTCPNLPKLAKNCPNLPKIVQICPNLPFLLFFHCFNKKMWLKKVLAWLNLALVISLSQCTRACLEFALESLELPFILSGFCSPSEANYCSNPFEVFFVKPNICNYMK